MSLAPAAFRISPCFMLQPATVVVQTRAKLSSRSSPLRILGVPTGLTVMARLLVTESRISPCRITLAMARHSSHVDVEVANSKWPALVPRLRRRRTKFGTAMGVEGGGYRKRAIRTYVRI